MVRTDRFHGFRPSALHPNTLLRSYTPEQSRHVSPDRCDDLSSRTRCRVCLLPEKGLATSKIGGNCADRHPNLGRELNSLILPSILVEPMATEPARKPKFVGMKFTHSFTKNRTAHRIEKVSSEQTVKLMAPVERRHVIEILSGHGFEESADAPRGQVRRPRRDHCTGLSAN